MFVKREAEEDVYAAVLQHLHDKAKARLPEPQCSAVDVTLIGSTSVVRCHREP